MACDICGRKGTSLVDLLDCYKTKDIQQLCPDCEKVVNGHASKLTSVVANIKVSWLRRFMENMRPPADRTAI